MPARLKVVRDSLAGENTPFRWMIEHMGDVVGILDAQGALLYVSPSLADLAGYQPEELVGRDVFEHVHPDGHADARAAMALALSTPGSSPTLELRCIHKDGSTRDVHATGTLMPLDAQGAMGIMFVARDVTQRRRGEAAKRLLARIVECSEEAVITTGPQGDVLTWNPAAERMFGHPAHEMLGKPASLLVPPEGAEATQRLEAAVLGGSVLHGVETERLHKDGTRVPVSLTTFAIRDDEDRVMGVVAIVRDRRDRVLAAQALEGQAALRALFRRTLREGTASMRTTGHRLADDVRAATMGSFVDAFVDLGLGHLEVVERHGDRYVVAGRDLLEARAGAARPTCSLPLGYLERAAGILSGGEGLGTELACQSLGAERCLFVVRGRAASEKGYP